MGILKSLAGSLPSMNEKAMLPTLYNNPGLTTFRAIGEGVKLYAADTGHTLIEKGYMSNPVVNTITATSGKKLGQVDFYHYKILRSERKTWEEYQDLMRKMIGMKDTYKEAAEAKRMRQKSIDTVIVDSQLTKFLKKPNYYQTGPEFRELLMIYKMLTGEGNIWLVRGKDDQGRQITKGKPLAMMVIPKGDVQLVKGSGPWDIAEYIITLGTDEYHTPKENLITWINPNPLSRIDTVSLEHMRGFAPLNAARSTLQAFNEGTERLVNINHNQGAAGLAYNKELSTGDITPTQSTFMRDQFDNIVNNKSMYGKIAMLGGEWGFHQFGMDVGQLKMLEQMQEHTNTICNVLGFPPGLLKTDQTYENQKTAERRWIFNVIAPAAYSLRDEFNENLVPAYDLDRELNVIDCNILDLPELSEDAKTKREALEGLWQLTPNQVLEQLGFDKVADPNMDRRYIPSGLSPLEDVAAPIDYND